jgi:hypothetical protein
MPRCNEEIYNTYLCANCGHDCEGADQHMKNPRIKIAKDLQDACLINDSIDLCNVVAALTRGENQDLILYEMPELERWHKAFSFLQTRF